MNIVLLCNKKNLLGNKLVIYTTLYCNSAVNFFIGLTEEIGDKEERNIQNLIEYMDSLSTVVFENINNIQSLEEQFSYLMHCIYIAPDCMVAQNFEDWYEQASENTATAVINQSNKKTCVAYIDLYSHRRNNTLTYIDYDDNGISNFLWGDINIDYFDSRIGYCGKFSFYFNMPIIFWFEGDNKKVYMTDFEEWNTLYPDFGVYIQQIQLAETIYF